MIVLEDPFKDREIDEVDEYENINDEVSDGDPSSQADAGNVQSKYRTVNIDSYKSAGSVRSRSPTYRCQVDSRNGPHLSSSSQQQYARNFKPPRSPLSITSLGSKGKEPALNGAPNQAQGRIFKLNLDKLLDNQTPLKLEHIEGGGAAGEASQKLTYRNQIVSHEEGISTPNSLSSEENFQSQPQDYNGLQKLSLHQNAQHIKILSNSQITEQHSYSQIPKLSLLADPTATPQFKNKMEDEPGAAALADKRTDGKQVERVGRHHHHQSHQ